MTTGRGGGIPLDERAMHNREGKERRREIEEVSMREREREGCRLTP